MTAMREGRCGHFQPDKSPSVRRFIQGGRELHEALSQGFGNGFGFGVDLQFVVDVAHMEGDRIDADP